MFYTILLVEVFIQGVFEFLTMITPYSTNLKDYVNVLLIQFCHNSSNPLDLVLRKFTQVNLYKSSTHTYKYLFPAMLSIFMGPIISMWTNSSTIV